MIESKKCCGCKEVKPYAEFCKNIRNKDGLQNYCKICARTYRQQYKAALVKVEVETKQCTTCSQTKHVSEFYNNECIADGYSYLCKSCGNEKKKIYDAVPEHKARNIQVSWERGQMKSAACRIVKVCSQCEICGIDDPNVLTIDHIEPALKKRKRNGNKVKGLHDTGNAHMILTEFFSENTRMLCIRCHTAHTTTQRNPDCTPGKLKRRQYINKKKMESGGCLECWYNNFADCSVFHYDHIEPESKIERISNMVGAWTDEQFWKSIDLELSKCRVLCANCHFIHSRKQDGSYINQQAKLILREEIQEGKWDHLSPLMSKVKTLLATSNFID